MTIVTAKRNVHSFRIYMDGLLHLEVLMGYYTGMQAWIEGTSGCLYKIEFYMSSGKSIVCEYGTKDLWERVLQLVAVNL